MKVLHVIRDLSVATGGPSTVVLGLAEAQARLGLKVAIVATDHGGEPRPLPDGVEVEIVPAWTGSWGFAPGLRAALERQVERADIVHLHMVWDYPIWAGARAAMRHRKPFILQASGQLDRWSLAQGAWKKRIYRTLLGAQLRHADAIHFTSEGERESSLPSIGASASFVIRNGVPEAAYSNLPPRTAFAGRFPELAGRRVVLFLGRLHPKKQPLLLIDAFADVLADFADAHLVLAGPGEAAYLAALADRARVRGVADRTTFTGLLAGAAVTEAYRAADVFVLPSLQENFGVAIVEAMAAGCPVVIGDRLDLAAEIDEAGAGLVRPAQVEEIASALRLVLGDPALAARMGAKGHEMVLRNYRWEPVAEQIIEAYREILRRYPEMSSGEPQAHPRHLRKAALRSTSLK